MKFLISNYSTVWSTEPYYFNAGLNTIEGVSSSIINPNLSIYDNFDLQKPDVFISSFEQLTKDVISYLRDNKNIKLLINISQAKIEVVESSYNAMLEMDLKPILFSNTELKSNIKYAHIMPGADIFLSNTPTVTAYNIDKLIFVDNEHQINKEKDGTYHYTTIVSNLIDKVDFVLSAFDLNKIYHNYNVIIFCGNTYIGSQISFDAIYSKKKVIFDTKDNADLDKIDEIFKKQKLFTSVKNKHTCLHRLKYLLSQASIQDIANKLNDKIESL